MREQAESAPAPGTAQARIEEWRRWVCAIGYLQTEIAPGHGNATEPNFRVFGTGIVIREHSIITARHVLLGLRAHVDNNGIPRDRCRVLFHVVQDQRVRPVLCDILQYGWINEHTLDLAFLDFKLPKDTVLTIGVARFPDGPVFPARVGQPITVMGYAARAVALPGDNDAGMPFLYSIGPLAQQGFIAAIAPHEMHPRLQRLILDVRTTEVFDGAPVLDTQSGVTLAVHVARSADRLLAFSRPLTAQDIRNFLAAHDESKGQ